MFHIFMLFAAKSIFFVFFSIADVACLRVTYLQHWFVSICVCASLCEFIIKKRKIKRNISVTPSYIYSQLFTLFPAQTRPFSRFTHWSGSGLWSGILFVDFFTQLFALFLTLIRSPLSFRDYSLWWLDVD